MTVAAILFGVYAAGRVDGYRQAERLATRGIIEGMLRGRGTRGA